MTRHQFTEPPQTWTACIAGHTRDPDKKRHATRGLLCEGHYLDLEQKLAEMPALLEDTESALVRYGNGLNPKVSGSKEQPLGYPAGKDGQCPAAEALRSVHATLASWVLLVVEEHPSRLRPPANATRLLSAFLLRHLDWCTEQPWVDDLLDEMRAARVELRQAETDSRSRRVTLGVCDQHRACDLASHAEVDPCSGTLRAVVNSDDDAPPSAIRCTDCAGTYTPEQWRTLAKRLRKDDAWLTAAQLSELLRVPVGTIWRWASEDEWRRVDRRPKRYHHADAQRSFEARHLEVAS